jgi:hypothetical protein
LGRSSHGSGFGLFGLHTGLLSSLTLGVGRGAESGFLGGFGLRIGFALRCGGALGSKRIGLDLAYAYDARVF